MAQQKMEVVLVHVLPILQKLYEISINPTSALVRFIPFFVAYNRTTIVVFLFQMNVSLKEAINGSKIKL
jgi:hypothetical protein